MSELPICPPEPHCPRCGNYANEDDADEWGHWVCRYCGYDPDNPDTCTICGEPISPKSENYGSSICEACDDREAEEQAEALRDWEPDGTKTVPFDELEEQGGDVPEDELEEDDDLQWGCADDRGDTDEW